MPMDLMSINRMDHDRFVAAFGAIFEHSPWVAERAHAARPFASIDALHAAMVTAVRQSSRETQLALLRAHPDLAGKEAQEGTMTRDSVVEQASAGLGLLTRAEMDRIAGPPWIPDPKRCPPHSRRDASPPPHGIDVAWVE